ncbi:MAG TPA: S41 family peptidase, partial [Spirochaetia bacterium]|nr:S41 family peptidase [Spirochaetia bacterium]
VERALRAPQRKADPVSQKPGPDFSLIHQAWDLIDRQYVDRSALGREPLTAGAISGLVDSLGDTGHSTYLTPSMVRDERSMMRGEYVGVGLEITMKNDNVVIVAPLDGSPALKAGLHAGEQIRKVNGHSVEGLGLNEVVSMIVGPADTTVVLTIFNPASGAMTEIPLRRARIHLDNLSWKPLPGYPFADIRLAAFSRGIAEELRAVLLKVEDMKLQGVVLDLRNNPGGELDEAIGVASQFLSSGDVVLEKDARGRISHDPVEKGGVAPRVPLVVLTNEGTASGAEIVAGALQDARRAMLIGETTFGTGTVLQNFPLSDGSSLLLAVREWLTPKGRVIWHKGIVPDTRVTLPADAMLVAPEDLGGMTKKSLDESPDIQMRKALEVLSRR